MSDLTLTRRALMAGAVVSAFAGPDIASASIPDAELLDLGRRFDAAAARTDAASDAVDVAWGAFVWPTVPEALFARPADGIGMMSCARPGRDRGRLWYASTIRDLDKLRFGFSFDCEDGTKGWQSDKPGLMRRDEVMAAFAAWAAEYDAASQACGLTAAEAERVAASVDARDLISAIGALPAASLAGVLVKARVAGWVYGGIAGLSDEIGSEESHAGGAVLVDILRDLLRLAA